MHKQRTQRILLAKLLTRLSLGSHLLLTTTSCNKFSTMSRIQNVIGSKNSNDQYTLLDNIDEQNNVQHSALYLSAQNGDLVTVKNLLKEGVDVNEKEEDGDTPLHVAALRGHVDVVKELLKNKNICRCAQNNHGDTPLHVAALCGHVDVVKELLPNMDCHIYFCNMPENRQNRSMCTPLHLAVEGGNLAVVKELVENRYATTSVFEKDNNGDSPLHIAIQKGSLELVKELAKSSCFRTRYCRKNNNGDTPLHIAVRNGNLEIVKELAKSRINLGMHEGDNNGNTSMHIAVEKSNVDLVKELVLVVNSPTPRRSMAFYEDKFKCTPLHFAVRNGNLEVMEELLKGRGSCIGQKDNYGNTALHIAVEQDNIEAVKLLIRAKNTISGVKIGKKEIKKSINLAEKYNHVECITILKQDLNKNKNSFFITSLTHKLRFSN